MSAIKPAMMDRLLAMDLPLMTMPHDTQAFKPLEESGHRLILAGNGLFKEIHRPWIYVRFQLASFETPFGHATEVIETYVKISTEHLKVFLKQAHREAPLETAGWLVWSEETNEVTYRELVADKATYSKLTVQRPELKANEHLVLDLHSHHVMKPTFSGTDDQDDKESGWVTLSGVVGQIDTTPHWNFRLCLEGHLMPVDIKNFLLKD
jgi:PRTRC genetic system protein A